MEAMASFEHKATLAVIGGAFLALSAVPKISKNLAAYLADLIVFTPHWEGTADPRAPSFAEAHAAPTLFSRS